MAATNLTRHAGSPDQHHPGGPVVRVENLSKQFPGTLALNNVHLDVRAGEVHVLFGENGAGKSTLIQILAGVHRPTSGRIYIRGKGVELQSVNHARSLGISAVFQEFSLVPQLTVEENLFLGAELTWGIFLNKARLHSRAKAALDRLGFPMRPQDRVMYLSRAEQQMVEIAKAFCSETSILILDEPTASLTERETERLFQLLHQLKREGIAIIYITHRMNEIHRIGDRITILRDGQYVVTVDAKNTPAERLVEYMTGRIFDQVYPHISHSPGKTLLKISNLTTRDKKVRDVSIEVRAGEVVGLAGLLGSGKSLVGRSCFGIEKIQSGCVLFDDEVVYDGGRINKLSPRGMLDRGLHYLPSDRQGEGLILRHSVRDNMTLSLLGLPKLSYGWLIRRVAEQRLATDLARRVSVVPFNIEKEVQNLSGGNQQKVLLAKALTREVSLFVLDEPTVGVDVGTRVLIYEFIRDLCEAGAGVLLISSDLPEILHLSHRTYVMYRGELCAELHESNVSEEEVLRHLFNRQGETN